MARQRQAGLGASLLASSATCTTSSRVGASTSACGPGRLSSFQLLKNGSRKAAVLPMPVWAWPMASMPVNAWGMKAAWRVVGSWYVARSRAARSGDERDNVWKPLGLSTKLALDKQTSRYYSHYLFCVFASYTFTVNPSPVAVQLC